MNPDCRDGKHASCSGDGWDFHRDEPMPCPCTCHDPQGDQVTTPTPEQLNDPEGQCLVQAIHDRKAGTELLERCERILEEHQQWVSSSCGPEDECICGAQLFGRSSAAIASHQASILMTELEAAN